MVAVPGGGLKQIRSRGMLPSLFTRSATVSNVTAIGTTPYWDGVDSLSELEQSGGRVSRRPSRSFPSQGDLVKSPCSRARELPTAPEALSPRTVPGCSPCATSSVPLWFVLDDSNAAR